jgi:hypothetical protein
MWLVGEVFGLKVHLYMDKVRLMAINIGYKWYFTLLKVKEGSMLKDFN